MAEVEGSATDRGRSSGVWSGLAVESAQGPPRPAVAEVADGLVHLTDDAAAQPGPVRSLLVPGLVNLHDHLRSMMPTGRRNEGAPLLEVITASSQTQEVAEPEDYRVLTALACSRLLRSGVTSVVDHAYPLHRPGLLEAVVEGQAMTGIRGSVALGIMTRGHAPICTGIDDIVAQAEQAVDQLLPADRLFLAPVSLRQTDPEAYGAAARAAERLGLRLYTHISETAAEVEQCVAEHGLRPVEFLHSVGFLNPGTVLVHCVELSDHEIDLLAETGASVVYCPSNHLKLAKGFARITDLVSAGVRVGLGIDGMESLFHEMRQAIFAQGEATKDTAALSSTTTYEMATTVGADVLGVAGVTGGLDGAPDLVRLDTGSSALQPLVDPVWSVVNKVGPGDVTDVVVAGRAVLEDGRLTTVDEADLVDRAWATTRRLADRIGELVPADWALTGESTTNTDRATDVAPRRGREGR